MTKNIHKVEELITDSSITYKGVVTTEKVFNNKVLETTTTHNEGHKDLFKLLANSIAGVYDLDIIPRYICGYNQYSESTGLLKQTFTGAIPYSSKKVQAQSSGDGYQIVFSFLIPYSQISASVSTKYYGLYSDPNLTTLIAHIDLGEGYKGDGVTNRVVTWTMFIGNSNNQ